MLDKLQKARAEEKGKSAISCAGKNAMQLSLKMV